MGGCEPVGADGMSSVAEPVTFDELRALFGDLLPMDAYAVLHPGGPGFVALGVRPALVESAIRHRVAPLRLDTEAERLAMAKLLLSARSTPPFDRWQADEVFDHVLTRPDRVEDELRRADVAMSLLRDYRVEMTDHLAGPRPVADDLSPVGPALDERSPDEVVALVSDMLGGEVTTARDAMGAMILRRGPVMVRLSFLGAEGEFGVEWEGGGALVQREHHLQVLRRRMEALVARSAGQATP